MQRLVKRLFHKFVAGFLLCAVLLIGLSLQDARPVQAAGTFSGLSASLIGNGSATFRFAFSGSSSSYSISLSTTSNMASDVYLNFGTGTGSPIVVTNPTKWDKFTCGRTLYWRVKSSAGDQSPIQTATVSCPSGTFSSLSASLPGNGPSYFYFAFSGSSSSYSVNLSTTSNMSSDVYLNFATGSSSPLSVSGPASKWNKYTCGRTLYWRVTSSSGVQSAIQTATVSCSFSNLSASLPIAGPATFNFGFNGPSSSYTINMSTTSNMASDVYTGFGTGTSSPISVSSPSTKWDKYTCGRTLYWRAISSSGTQSAIQSATVSCPAGTFSNLSSSLVGNSANFSFSFSGSSTGYTVNLSTTSDMSTDVYNAFATGTTSPVVITNPTKWDKYTCGRTLYWRVISSSGVPSNIQTATVICTFSNFSAHLFNTATFGFSFDGPSTSYTINISTTSGMTSDVYNAFGTGTASPVVVSNPTKWDKYTCGRTLYWRVVSSSGVQSPIQSYQINCVFSNLVATLPGAGPATFNFSFSGPSSSYTVDVSTTPGMTSDNYNGFGTGSSIPVSVANPSSKWDKYTCGRPLYWRVTSSSGVQSGIGTATVDCPAGTFTNLSASLVKNGSATFNFTYSGSATTFAVNLSTTSDMSTDVYQNFGTGTASPVVVTNPTKWDKFTCGRPLYWRVIAAAGGQSNIQSATVECPASNFSGLSATLLGNGAATFNFTYGLSATSYTIKLSTTSDMSSDVYQSFATGTASPVVETNPTKWDKYTCGRPLYWRVVANPSGEQSDIQSATVTCTTTDTFSNLSADLQASGSATFNFTYSGTSSSYTVILSTTPDLSSDVFQSFGTGTASPVVVPNPTKWDKYTCGKVLYWQVISSSNIKSLPLAALVNCPASTGRVTTTFTRKVFVLTFNPWLPSKNKTLIDYKSYAKPADLTQQYINFMKSASHGRLVYNVVGTMEVNDTVWFTKNDSTNFAYTEASYLDVIDNGAVAHGSMTDQATNPTHTDYAKYEEFMDDPNYDLCGKLNRGEIDEVWLFGGPWFGFYEARLAGPGAFVYNSDPYTTSTCNKLLPIMGFSYQVGYGNMVEDFMHRSEATMDHVYGGRNILGQTTNWDKFVVSIQEAPSVGYSGCGWAHYPPNGGPGLGGNGYDWSNGTAQYSICDDFYNYPNLGNPQTVKKLVSCSAWGCTQLGYFDYWMDHIPTYELINPDGKLNDWWPYLIDPNLAK